MFSRSLQQQQRYCTCYRMKNIHPYIPYILTGRCSLLASIGASYGHSKATKVTEHCTVCFVQESPPRVTKNATKSSGGQGPRQGSLHRSQTTCPREESWMSLHENFTNRCLPFIHRTSSYPSLTICLLSSRNYNTFACFYCVRFTLARVQFYSVVSPR